MQTHLKKGTIAGGNIFSNIRLEAKYRLIEEIQPLVAPHGVGVKALSIAIEESLLEICEKSTGIYAEEIQSRLIGHILWKLFARGSALWVNPQTKAGNQVPLNLLVAAYSAWKSAAKLAIRKGIDTIAAAEALVRVIHDTADLLSKNAMDSVIQRIHDINHYIYTSYAYRIRRIEAKRNSREPDSADIESWIAEREISDQGLFLEILDNAILCRELLNAMQPKGRSVAIARYILGYSWPEIADSLGTTINAAQKALNLGIRTAFGVCTQELPKMGSKRAPYFRAPQLKKKKNRFWRKMLTDAVHR